MKKFGKDLSFITLLEISCKAVKKTAIDICFVAEAANISYDMAAKYIDLLIKNGIVGEIDANGKCKVHITEAGLEYKLNTTGLGLFDKSDDEDFDENFDEDYDEDFDEDCDEELDDKDDSLEGEIARLSGILKGAFESFSIGVKIESVDVSPRLLRFVLVPEKGVKVSSVLNLEDDIALYLAVRSVRMQAPIPGRSAIGVEIPRNTPEVVHLTELFKSDEAKAVTAPTAACIGKDIESKPVVIDLAKMPHTLIGGATGMGKSCLIDCIITSIAKNATPDEVKLVLIDPKMVEFTKYKGLPHLLCDPIHGIPEALGALKWANDEMKRRYKLYQESMVVRLKDYNENAPEGKTLPEIVIVIDELADLMMRTKREAEAYIARLAQKSRAAGIYLVIATQRPDVNIVTGTLKANIPARICFKTASAVDSRTVLDTSGAEKLLDRGDVLISTPSAVGSVRVQCAFVSEEEIDGIIAPIKTDTADFDAGLAKAMEMGKKLLSIENDRDSEESKNNLSLLSDPQFHNAVEVALAMGMVSTALLQRKLSIGFGKAARFIDAMEDMGLVSEKCGAKPRSVLFTREEWIEKFSRTEL